MFQLKICELVKYTEKDIDGVFILIGYVPSTEKVKGLVELNNRNEIVTDENMATNLPGVFAAGDSRQKKYRQVTTAVSDGTIAALASIEYLEKDKKRRVCLGLIPILFYFCAVAKKYKSSEKVYKKQVQLLQAD